MESSIHSHRCYSCGTEWTHDFKELGPAPALLNEWETWIKKRNKMHCCTSCGSYQFERTDGVIEP